MTNTAMAVTMDGKGNITVAIAGSNEDVIDMFADTYRQITEELQLSVDDLFTMVKAIIAANKAVQTID